MTFKFDTTQSLITPSSMAREMERKIRAANPVTAELATSRIDPEMVELTFTHRNKDARVFLPVADLILPLDEFSEKHIKPELFA